MLGAPAVVIVEHDESVRESLPDLLNLLGYAAQTFTSAEQFLASRAVCEARCLLLEIGLPGMSGPELHRELMRRGFSIPTIFMTGHVGECSIPHGPARPHMPLQAVQRAGTASGTRECAAREMTCVSPDCVSAQSHPPRRVGPGCPRRTPFRPPEDRSGALPS